jgi:hypothetical protein
LSIHDNATAILKKAIAFEGHGSNPMPKTARVLSYDDFRDGSYNGWRPVHFNGDVPWPLVTIESDYPAPGLFLSTGYGTRQSGAVDNTTATFKGMSSRMPTSGIISFSGKFYLQSGSAEAYAFSTWGIQMDIQNWDSSFRAHPTIAFAAGSGDSRPQWQLATDQTSIDGTMANVSGVHPIKGGTSAPTAGLTAGMNESKWDENYIRLSYDLGNLFTRKTGDSAATRTDGYYELNINGYRFDLRGQGGNANESPQASSVARYFDGGLNIGISMARSVDPTILYPARMVATELASYYHETGWLA